MSAADPASPSIEIASSTRRKSGRVSRKPEKFTPGASPSGSAKRKRGGDGDGDGETDNDSGLDEDASSSDQGGESSEGEPDEEELRERRRKKKSRPVAKRSAPKKPKTNGDTLSLAIRPATNAARKPSKRPRKAPVRKSMLPEQAAGLYGRRFTSCAP